MDERNKSLNKSKFFLWSPVPAVVTSFLSIVE